MTPQNDPPGEDDTASSTVLDFAIIGIVTLLATMLVCAAVRALITGSLYAPFRIGRGSQPMFPVALHGSSAVLGALCLLFLAASFLSICSGFRVVAHRLPAWVPRLKWWLFAISMVFFFAARRSQSI